MNVGCCLGRRKSFVILILGFMIDICTGIRSGYPACLSFTFKINVNFPRRLIKYVSIYLRFSGIVHADDVLKTQQS